MGYIFAVGECSISVGYMLYFRCRRVLSKAQLAEIQSPDDPHVQTGLRTISNENAPSSL